MRLALYVQAGPHLVKFDRHPVLDSMKKFKEFADTKGELFKTVVVAVDLDELGDVLEVSLTAWSCLADLQLRPNDSWRDSALRKFAEAFGKAIVYGKERVCPVLMQNTRTSSPPKM